MAFSTEQTSIEFWAPLSPNNHARLDKIWVIRKWDAVIVNAFAFSLSWPNVQEKPCSSCTFRRGSLHAAFARTIKNTMPRSLTENSQNLLRSNLVSNKLQLFMGKKVKWRKQMEGREEREKMWKFTDSWQTPACKEPRHLTFFWGGVVEGVQKMKIYCIHTHFTRGNSSCSWACFCTM